MAARVKHSNPSENIISYRFITHHVISLHARVKRSNASKTLLLSYRIISYHIISYRFITHHGLIIACQGKALKYL
eukprot:g9565.t1